MMNRREFMGASALGLTAGFVGLRIGSPQDGPTRLDPGLRPYQVVAGVSGNASSVGSDTLNNLMTFWAELFKRSYPNVNIQIEGKGSGTAPPALTQGTAQFGPMSRPMKPTEEDSFESKWGYKPTQIKTAVDALGVFVNKDNPIKSLSLDEVDAIFSKARRRGERKSIATWSDAGLTGEWADKPISLYGRNSASGTYSFFKEHVLKTGDYKDEVKEQPGSASVVLAVATDRYGIGYSGIGYATSSVRAVALSDKKGESPKAANAENAYSGDYPLARFLYVYINRAPGKPCDPLVREFIRMICSKEGQEIVVKDGYFPILANVADQELKKVE
jgi:phosphate transport system substrate-binding protein